MSAPHHSRASGSLRIRQITADTDERDIVAVSALAVAAYGGDYTLTSEYLEEIGDVRARVASADVWAAEFDGEIVGTVTLPRPGMRLHDDTADDEMDVRLLAVDPRARRRGVGEALMRHSMEIARSRGARRIVLHTGSQMVGAQRLYERMGFERIPEREYLFEVTGVTYRLMVYGFALAAGDAPESDARAEGGDRAREEAQTVDA